MTMLFVPRERGRNEHRVAATPETVTRLAELGLEVTVESGAGEGARITDGAFRDAGAVVADDLAGVWGEADLVCTVGPPPVADAKRMAPGAVLIGMLAPHHQEDLVVVLADGEITSLSLELIPRISRAQSMDALSSQASIAGYRAVIKSAYLLDKHFPLFMTAAGTIRPGKVVLLGAGVAGLAAVATAHRLGANVEVSDIREAAKDEVESLGAEFIAPPGMQADDEETGGYAREQDKDALTLQQEQLAEHVTDAHAVICSAFVPGRPAPPLLTEAAVDGMQAGSVVLDMAAAEGGNCAVTDPAQGTVERGGVRVVAASELASEMPSEASALYARNLVSLIELLVEDGELVVDRGDEIIAGALLTADGGIHHAPTAEALGEPVADQADGGDGGDGDDQAGASAEAAGDAPESAAATAASPDDASHEDASNEEDDR